MHRVLVVDPDPKWAQSVRQALEAEDCWVEPRSSGAEAIASVADGAVDIVITEARLADMPGWELVSKVRNLDPHIPVVVVTEDDSWETSRRVRVEGDPVFYFALKPMDLQVLRSVVHYAARWREGHGQRSLRGHLS